MKSAILYYSVKITAALTTFALGAVFMLMCTGCVSVEPAKVTAKYYVYPFTDLDGVSHPETFHVDVEYTGRTGEDRFAHYEVSKKDFEATCVDNRVASK